MSEILGSRNVVGDVVYVDVLGYSHWYFGLLVLIFDQTIANPLAPIFVYS